MCNNLSLLAQPQIVQRLPVHLDMQQSSVFEESQAQAAADAGPKHTELLAYFDLNRGEGVNDDTCRLAQSLLYHDIPRYFRLNSGKWIRRKKQAPDDDKSVWCRKKPVIGRMQDVNIKDEEQYSLRTLLLQVKGAESYSDLKTVELRSTRDDGTEVVEHRQCDSFLEACVCLGLRGADGEWDKACGTPELTACQGRSDPYLH